MKMIEIAGIKFAFTGVEKFLMDKLEEFEVNEKSEADISINLRFGIMPQEAEGQIYLERSKENYVLHASDKMRDYLKYLIYALAQVDFQHLLLERKACILHSSYIIHEGNGIVFTAPSGTGKSTQADLWRVYQGAEIINGDRSVLKMKDHYLYVHGIPFSGSSNICKNKEAPLRAIVVLGQSEYNQIRRMSPAEAVKYLYSQTAVNRGDLEEVDMVFRLLETFVSQVPVLRLDCRPDEGAVQVLEDYLKEKTV